MQVSYVQLIFCLSVCLSVTLVVCLKKAKHINKLFSLSVRPIVIVFSHQTSWQNSDVVALNCPLFNRSMHRLLQQKEVLHQLLF